MSIYTTIKTNLILLITNIVISIKYFNFISINVHKNVNTNLDSHFKILYYKIKGGNKMSFCPNNLITFIKQNRITIKILFSLSILISLFIGAIILHNTNFSTKVSDIDEKNSFEIISIHNNNKKTNPDVCEAQN